MGLALAEQAAARGAEVTLIAANVGLPEPPGVKRIDVATTAELEAAVAERFPACQVLLMAAAVADFRPAEPAAGKISRGSEGLDLHLEPTADVLATVAARRQPGQTVVGFAAEHGEGALDRARQKLGRKGADAIVLNDVSRPEIGFESERNEAVIVDAEAETRVPLASKSEVAERILDRVQELRAGGQPAPRGGSASARP
jgi:phosphopantothenoylcysteine decarboxylase/phosphopantothenate--cysteine ligase